MDLSRLIQFAGTQERLTELSKVFVSDLTDRLRTIRRSVAQRDCRVCTEVAHAAAGSCGAIGAIGMANSLKSLEEDAFNDRLNRADSLLAEIDAEFERVKRMLAGPQSEAAINPNAAKPAAGRVLIIEDDLFVAGLYRARLEAENYEVNYAQDGQTGFYRIHEWKPDLVLLDLMLPNINGLDILKKIRAERAYRELPVLVFTNSLVPTLLRDATDAGATYIFNKTATDPEQMLTAIRASLNPLPPSLGAPPASSSPLETLPQAPAATEAVIPGMDGPPPPAETIDKSETPIPVAEDPPPTTRRQPRRFDASAMRMKRTPGPAAEVSPAADEVIETPERSPHEIILEHVALLRTDFQSFSRANAASAKAEVLGQMYQRMHALTGTAGITGLKAMAEISGAVELFVRELKECPGDLGRSTVRTLAQSIDFLARLANCTEAVEPIADSNPLVLVVDDDRMCREVVGHALKRARIQSLQVDSPTAALAETEKQSFDLIVLDVTMPGMDGFELCREIRKKLKHASTPLVFVTGMTDLASRGQSRLSGGDDHISKPFRVIELTVKAVIHILASRLPESTGATQRFSGF